MTTLTPEYFVTRWSDPTSPRLIKECLIDETGCCCAHGDVLRCAGFTDQQLRSMTQTTADREVARLLGISFSESVLIRVINDSTDGCPQDVFKAPEKVLGPHHRLWTAFAKHLDRMRKEDWNRVAAARDAAADAVWDAAAAAAGDAAAAAVWAAAAAAARDAAWDAVWDEAWDAAADAAREAAAAAASDAASDAASHAAYELIGWSKLEEPFFLKMFFDDPRAWVESIEEADGGAA